MKTVTGITVMLFAASPGAAVFQATVTAQELASAINKADAELVRYRVRTLSPRNIRTVRCIASEKEPTEFQCKWQQRVKRGWIRRMTWLSLDGIVWHVMDA